MKDKNGVEIKEGDCIFNESDKYQYYQVKRINNRLCIEDEFSPLEKYSPEKFWEVKNTEVARKSVQQSENTKTLKDYMQQDPYELSEKTIKEIEEQVRKLEEDKQYDLK